MTKVNVAMIREVKINTQMYVISSLQVEGFHYWKDAPEVVGFLRDNHRHMFHIEVKKEVTHGDRDVEIILLRRAVIEYLFNRYKSSNGAWLEFGSMSCEMIAEDLVEAFDLTACRVMEDGENGACVTRD